MRIIAKFTLLLSALVVGLGFNVGQPFAQEKQQELQLIVAVVDMVKINATATAPISVREQMNNKRKAYQAEMQKEENTLREGQQELARQRAILSPEALKSERAKFQEKFVAVQKKMQVMNSSLEKARVAALEKISEALKSVINKIVSDHKITLLLRKELTVISAKQLDISDLAIKELNKALPSVVVFPKAKGAK